MGGLSIKIFSYIFTKTTKKVEIKRKFLFQMLCSTSLKYNTNKYKNDLTEKPALLMGQEIAAEFHKWKNPEKVAALAKITIVPRFADYSVKDVEKSKKIYDDFGELLFTHFGVSGPIILSASAHLLRYKDIDRLLKEGKIKLTKDKLCYKKRRGNKTSMMNHTKWNLDNKTILPISLRPKYINKRDELGHLEIDSILGKKDEQQSIISIVDRCTRRLWLIKADYKNEYYIDRLIYNYIFLFTHSTSLTKKTQKTSKHSGCH